MAPQRQPASTNPPSLRANSFLSPTQYDDDASSLHSDRDRSDQETDSEDDEVLMGARSSADIRAHDRGVLLEEEERDRLLLEEKRRRGSRNGRRGSGLEEFVGRFFKKGVQTDEEERGFELEEKRGGHETKGQGKKQKRKQRRERRRLKKERLFERAEYGEDGKLMHEMEEGGMKEGSSTGESSESDEVDRRGLQGLQEDKANRRRRWRNWCFIHLIIVVGFAILVLFAYKISLQRREQGRVTKTGQKLLSNGTALFAPTTILISLDGFRADFLNRGITPRLNRMIKEGVSPLYMNPSFPSVTFPNHYTLATGLYPEAHGIVGNTFWDVDMHEEFYYTHPDAMQPKWWGGEPIWVTAESQGIRTAIHMWPGSEAHIAGVEPAFLDRYNGKELLSRKVDRVLGLLDRKGSEDVHAQVAEMRPQFIAAYVPNVDADGHRFGPNSTEIRATIQAVDTMLDDIFNGLDKRNLTNIVNVVVVSDHGMATTDVTRLIQLEDLIDTSLIAHTDGWPLYGLRPKDPKDLQHLYDTLVEKSKKNDNYEVYLRDVNMPERYHFSKNERIAPLWIVPKTGWAIVKKSEMNVVEAIKQKKVYHPRGLHGYDHEHPLMRAIFVARGPAFPHTPGSKVAPFQNIEVYNIVCDSLSLDPRPNNGTIRLPFKTIGIHDSDHPESVPSPPETFTPPISSNPDPKPDVSPSPAPNHEAASEQKPAPTIGIDVPKPSKAVGVDEPKTGAGEGKVEVTEPGKGDGRPVVNDEETKDGEEGKGKGDGDGGFLKWLKGQVEKMKGWIEGITGKDGEKKGEKEAHKGSSGV